MIEVTTSTGNRAHYSDQAYEQLARFVIEQARAGAVVTVTYHNSGVRRASERGGSRTVPDIAGRDL